MYIKFLATVVTICLPILTLLSAIENIPFLFGFSLIMIPIWFLVLALLAHEEAEGRL
jgi:hypothetical protein